MKFLCISDIHGNIKNLKKMEEVFKSVDAVLFAGDFAECFKTETSKPVLDQLIKMHDEIYAVLGNCDEPEFIEELEDAGINAERTLSYTQGFAIIGSGGGSKFTGKTPNERELTDLMEDFKILDSAKEDTENSDKQDGKTWPNLIILSHNPPKGEKVDSFAPGMHAGSELLTSFVLEKKPLALVTGHIHEGTAIEKIGDTLVINPGSLGEKGTYALLTVEKKENNYTAEAELKSLE
ncbi:MAG: metallophosphoesterase family protein [Treponema sp.]|nr:metallophosphoesterase family protein [Treponema sp.]